MIPSRTTRWLLAGLWLGALLAGPVPANGQGGDSEGGAGRIAS